MSIENLETGKLSGTSGTSGADSLTPLLTIDGVEKKKTRKRSVRTAKYAIAPQQDEDDAELQDLLLQVDRMLTEMTQSKWLSSDWPALEIDAGPS